MAVVDAGGRMLAASSGMARLFGCGRAELVGRPLRDLVPGAALGGAPQRFPATAIRPDGSRLPVDVTVSELEGARAITLAEVAGEGAPAAAARAGSLRPLVEGIREHALFLLDPLGGILTWNAGAERMTGYPCAEAVGRNHAMLFTLEDRAAARPVRVLEAALQGQRAEDEGWRVRRDGSRFWADSLITRLVDGQGRPCGFGTVTHDLTEQRRAEAAERVRTRFLQIAAHELRNPMAGVKGLLDLVRRRQAAGRPPGDLAYALDLLGAEVDRLAYLLDEILDALRVGQGALPMARQPLDLAEVVAQGVEVWHRLHPARVELDLGPPGLCRIVGDARRLEEVVVNLVGNALKYSPADAPVHVRLARAGPWARLTVTDRGLGIPAADRERIFEGFYRAGNLAGRDPGGVGLGLFVCRSIVSGHGGRIWAEGGEGAGTEMVVELPLREDAAPTPGPVAGG